MSNQGFTRSVQAMLYKPTIKEFRESKGITQKWLASQIGVSSEHLSKWERQKSYPTAPFLLKMCKILNCRVEDLYEEIEE